MWQPLGGRRPAPEADRGHQARDEQGRDDRRRDVQPHAQPRRRGVGAGADRVGDGQAVDHDHEPVGLPPQSRSDATADVEAQAEDRGHVAADDSEAGPQGPVGHRERDRDPGGARVEPRIAEQRQSVNRDRDQRRDRGLLVDRVQDARQPRLLRHAPGEREAEADGDRDQRQRDQAGGTAGQPPGVTCEGRVHAARLPSATLRGTVMLNRGRAGSGPMTSTWPSS